MSDADTSYPDVYSIRTRIDPLPASPAQKYTLLTLYLRAPLDCITAARRSRQD